MSDNSMNQDEVDVVITALNPNLGPFLEEWRPVLTPYHLIIVKDPILDHKQQDLNIPPGFNSDVYTKSHMETLLGHDLLSSLHFSGLSARYFGYLVSTRRYIVAIDPDCVPMIDEKGHLVDPIKQHLQNLTSPSTPYYFNTLYDPYRPGTDFVRGYPFSLRSGASTALSCGLWVGLPDYDAPTALVKAGLTNSRCVNAVMTVPRGAFFPVSGVNLAFDKSLIGVAMFSGLLMQGKTRYETLEDIWAGLCAKAICDHLGYGAKSGLPYVVRRKGGGSEALEALKKEWKGVKWMEEVLPFFQSLTLPRTAVTAEDCILEIAKNVKVGLGGVDAAFVHAAVAMEDWVRAWKSVLQSGSSQP
ncbi:hypothetical protein AMTRI_Chr06g173680 [Amborella trichopoda]|uniref:UDP-arabinopyranose mutase n=1 Tax=Amborella trichopoda TaxID=13333 RepID=W1PVM3_AMBTC|nr:probable UDP-arabinopyranose mutase 5 [Amborella trichopoda]ERN11874.1 hypothetical protein AMTR_s00020p00173350 [Amborella trichopoda]|eukprot:XP_006850293.1 probable UDP-arabinopyranose mutase 5 [Amborella trichopoda]